MEFLWTEVPSQTGPKLAESENRNIYLVIEKENNIYSLKF